MAQGLRLDAPLLTHTLRPLRLLFSTYTSQGYDYKALAAMVYENSLCHCCYLCPRRCYSYLPSLPRCLLREYAMLPSVSKLSAPRLAGRGGGEESALRDSSSCGVSRITEILTYAGPTDQARPQGKQRTQESRSKPQYPSCLIRRYFRRIQRFSLGLLFRSRERQFKIPFD